jgi:hypothetical protein
MLTEKKMPRITRKPPLDATLSTLGNQHTAAPVENDIQALDLRMRRIIGNIAREVGKMGKDGQRGLSKSARDVITKEMSTAKAATLTAARHGHRHMHETMAEPSTSSTAIDARKGTYIIMFKDGLLSKLSEMVPTKSLELPAGANESAQQRDSEDSAICDEICEAIRLAFYE